MRRIFATAIALVAACAVAACGQKASTRTNTAITPAPVASTYGAPYGTQRRHRHGYSGAMQSSNGMGNPNRETSQAPIPPNLGCTNSRPVWVNTRTKVYHVPEDPLYGRTRHGQYMCENDAVAAGDHAAKTYK